MNQACGPGYPVARGTNHSESQETHSSRIGGNRDYDYPDLPPNVPSHHNQGEMDPSNPPNGTDWREMNPPNNPALPPSTDKRGVDPPYPSRAPNHTKMNPFFPPESSNSTALPPNGPDTHQRGPNANTFSTSAPGSYPGWQARLMGEGVGLMGVDTLLANMGVTELGTAISGSDGSGWDIGEEQVDMAEGESITTACEEEGEASPSCTLSPGHTRDTQIRSKSRPVSLHNELNIPTDKKKQRPVSAPIDAHQFSQLMREASENNLKSFPVKGYDGEPPSYACDTPTASTLGDQHPSPHGLHMPQAETGTPGHEQGEREGPPFGQLIKEWSCSRSVEQQLQELKL